MQLQLIEAFCAILGICGTILIAFRKKQGYFCYIPSNILWILYGFVTSQYFFGSQYIFFLFMSFVGLFNWTKKDRLDSNNMVDSIQNLGRSFFIGMLAVKGIENREMIKEKLQSLHNDKRMDKNESNNIGLGFGHR